MCKYCDELFTGMLGEDIISKQIPVGETEIPIFLTEVYLCDDDKDACLSMCFWIGSEVIDISSKKVNYCPMCGRKLVREIKE